MKLPIIVLKNEKEYLAFDSLEQAEEFSKGRFIVYEPKLYSYQVSIKCKPSITDTKENAETPIFTMEAVTPYKITGTPTMQLLNNLYSTLIESKDFKETKLVPEYIECIVDMEGKIIHSMSKEILPISNNELEAIPELGGDIASALGIPTDLTGK